MCWQSTSICLHTASECGCQAMGWEHNEKVFPLCTLSILNGALAIGRGLVYLGQKLCKLTSCTSHSTIENFTLYTLCTMPLSLLFFACIPGKGNKTQLKSTQVECRWVLEKRPWCKGKVAICERIHNWVITNQPNLQPARRVKRDEGDGEKREVRDWRWQMGNKCRS
jgi:hypothetical protein